MARVVAEGKTIGSIEGGVFKKTVAGSRHLFRAMNAWGIDSSVVNGLPDCTKIEIVDSETGTVYRTCKETYLSCGVRKSFGHGEQMFLPLSRFSVSDKDQIELF